MVLLNLDTWGDIADNWSKILGFLVAGAGAIGAIIFIYNKCKNVFGHIQQFYRNIYLIPSAITDLKSEMAFVRKEITPNGGKSLRDVINRIDLRQMATEAKSRSMLQYLKVPFWEADVNGLTTYSSRELCRITGRNPEELNGYGWINAVAPKDQDLVQKEWFESVKESREFSLEYSYLTPNGNVISIHAASVLIRDERGIVLSFLGFITPMPEEQDSE